MNLYTRILFAYRYLFFCSLEQRLLQGFQSIWFWIPLLFWNYSEVYFPLAGIFYVGTVGGVLLWTRPKTLQASYGAYFLDHYYQTQGEISAWFEYSRGPFASLLESRIQHYSMKRMPRPPGIKIFFWMLPTLLLLSVPVFRSQEEWALEAKKQKLREQLESLESSSSMGSSLQSDIQALKQQLEDESTTWEALLKQIESLEAKAKKTMPLTLSEQKLLDQLFKQFPQFQEWLEKRAPELEKFLEAEKIPEALQEKIFSHSSSELSQALEQSKHVQESLLNPLQSILPKTAFPQENQTKTEAPPEIQISWGEEKKFPEVPASPRFRELLEHLGKDFSSK